MSKRGAAPPRAGGGGGSGGGGGEPRRAYKLCFASVSTGESKVDEDRAAGALVRAARGLAEARGGRAARGAPARVALVLVGPVHSALLAKVKRKAAAEGLAGDVLAARYGALAEVDDAFALGVGAGERWRRPGENRENVELHRAGLQDLAQGQFREDDAGGILAVGDVRVVAVPEANKLRKSTGARVIICVRGPVVNESKPGFCGADYASNGAETALEAAYLRMFLTFAARADDEERELRGAEEDLARAKRRKRDPVQVPPLLDVLANRIGLGTLALGVEYPRPRLAREDAIELLVGAMRVGVQFFDTADTYARDGDDLHYVERILCEAKLRFAKEAGDAAGERILIATKGGMDRRVGDSSSRSWIMPARLTPESIVKRIEGSFRALGGRQPLALWQLHHCPRAERDLVQLMRAAQTCVEQGFVDRLGLCNVTLSQLRAVLDAGIPIASVQNELAAWDLRSVRATGKFGGVLHFCLDHKIAFIAIKTFGGTAFRKESSGFRGLTQRFSSPTSGGEGSPSLFALWLGYSTRKWPCLIHVPGATRLEHVKDCQRGVSEAIFDCAQMSALEGVFE